MTPRPTRLALLISLMGIGLSTTGPAWADAEADRAAAHDVERVMRVLGLDTGIGVADPVPAPKARRALEPVAEARPVAVVATRPDRPAPRRGAREASQPVRPASIETKGVEETSPPELPEAMPPAEPEAPAHPVDLALAATPTTRPVDEDPDSPPTPVAWTLDALPPPEPPVADEAAGEPVAELADGIDAYEALIQKLAASDDPVTSVAQAERVMRHLAGLRAEGITLAEVPLVDVPVLHDAVEPEVLPAPAARLSPRAEYVQARLAALADADAKAVFAAPADRVLGDLAAMMGRVEDEEDEAATAAAAPEPRPSERVLEDLARVRGAPWDGEALAMDKARLDTMRGGFTTGEGLKLSFGIERAVYINGNLVTTTSLNISDLGAATAGRASATVNGSLALVQSGTGNTFLPGTVSSTAVGTVIQNTLDNQKIQHVTVVNATVNSMQVLRAMNLQHAVRTAITDSIRR